MTEDEAKTKWCPHARQNDGSRLAALNRCIASACMAWRWKRERQNNRMVKVGGWCGLAGGPND